MKLYKCIVDDGQHVYRAFCTAKSFEKIEDVTGEYFTDGTCEKLNDDLLRMRWGEGERRLICALVEEHISKIHGAH